jgi:hypothetical protein
MGVKPKTKVMLRKLPPNLTEEDLLQVRTYIALCSLLSALSSLLSTLCPLLSTTCPPLPADQPVGCRPSRRGQMTTTGSITTGARGGRERSGRVWAVRTSISRRPTRSLPFLCFIFVFIFRTLSIFLSLSVSVSNFSIYSTFGSAPRSLSTSIYITSRSTLYTLICTYTHIEQGLRLLRQLRRSPLQGT